MQLPSVIRRRSHNDPRWQVVLLLLVVVLLPSSTVLWLTDVAVRNERAAIREELGKTYRQHLALAVKQVDDDWGKVRRECVALADRYQGAELFLACVTAGVADSVLLVGTDGRIEYPTRGDAVPTVTLNTAAWQTAHRLEFVDVNLAVAADAYEAIARVESDPNTEARGWMARARCLNKLGRRDAALRVLTETLNRDDLIAARDASGRSVWLDAQLRALELLQDAADNDPARIAELVQLRDRIRDALRDYELAFTAGQRLFAMKKSLPWLAADPSFSAVRPFPTLAAESLAARYRESLESGALNLRQLASDPHCVWFDETPMVLLFGEDTLQRRVGKRLDGWHTDETEIELVADASPLGANDVAQLPIGSLPGRSLVIRLSDRKILDDNSRRHTAVYTFAGLLTIATIAVVAIAIAWFVGRETRMAQLKNDLVATVTHELRTPLASMRLLVDTLIDGGSKDPQQTSEYLGLIAQENERLSRMIDNFLAFSRRQRGPKSLDLRDVPPSELCQLAVAASGNRIVADDCDFRTDLSKDLPDVRVDEDAMVMVLVNLLDNAVKFSGEKKNIRLSATVEQGVVTFGVHDNGVGMSSSDLRHIFERFYQADTRLSRRFGGCGIGLSLVKSIVDQHGGTVDVESEPQRGSTFSVRLPAAPGDRESGQP